METRPAGGAAGEAGKGSGALRGDRRAKVVPVKQDVELTLYDRQVLRAVGDWGHAGWPAVQKHLAHHPESQPKDAIARSARSLVLIGLLTGPYHRHQKPALTAEGRWVLSLTT